MLLLNIVVFYTVILENNYQNYAKRKHEKNTLLVELNHNLIIFYVGKRSITKYILRMFLYTFAK